MLSVTGGRADPGTTRRRKDPLRAVLGVSLSPSCFSPGRSVGWRGVRAAFADFRSADTAGEEDATRSLAVVALIRFLPSYGNVRILRRAKHRQKRVWGDGPCTGRTASAIQEPSGPQGSYISRLDYLGTRCLCRRVGTWKRATYLANFIVAGGSNGNHTDRRVVGDVRGCLVGRMRTLGERAKVNYGCPRCADVVWTCACGVVVELPSCGMSSTPNQPCKRWWTTTAANHG